MPAVVSRNETGRHRELSWPELRRQVAALALHLKAQGVGRGDRVAAYLPNIPEAMVALLATASRSEEHTSELQSQSNLVCRLLLEKKKTTHLIEVRKQLNTV